MFIDITTLFIHLFCFVYQHLRKKMENRRLDYDCKKRKQKQGSTLNDEELRIASEKFDESKTQAEEAMSHLLNNEVRKRMFQILELFSSI
jgi:hypothetical protein